MRFAKPPITRLSTPNFDIGRAGYPVVGLCYHIAAGSRDGTVSWFANPASQVSAHFLICRDGEILQFVDITDTAWTQGTINKPTWPLLKTYPKPNRVLIGIEHEGNPGDLWTGAMYKADVALTLYLCERLGIKPERPYLLGHSELDSVDRPNCPGPNFPWPTFLDDLQRAWKGTIAVPDNAPKFVRPIPVVMPELPEPERYRCMGWLDANGVTWAPVRAVVESLGGAVTPYPADGQLERAEITRP